MRATPGICFGMHVKHLASRPSHNVTCSIVDSCVLIRLIRSEFSEDHVP